MAIQSKVSLNVPGFHDRIDARQAELIWKATSDAGALVPAANAVIVHDLSRLRQRIRRLRDVFPKNTLHAVAIKANPVVEVLRECVLCGSGLEAASIEEVHLAIAADCPPSKIVFDSPAKTIEEIEFALDKGITLNVDNFSELERVAVAWQTIDSTSSVGLRVNPEVGAGTIAETSVASVGSKFGVSFSADREKIREAFGRYEWLRGLHAHVGSQGCGVELLGQSAGKMNGLVNEIESHCERKLDWLNIGGGLPATYGEDDNPPTPSEYISELSRVCPALLDSDLQIVTEFGRAIHAGCGIAFSRIEYVRQDSESEFMAVIHLGADFLLRPVYRASQWSHEFLLLDAHGQTKTSTESRVTIAGPLCFSGDILARDLPMSRPESGDWIAIRDVGAYTLSMWSHHCNRGIPAVIGYDQDAIDAKARYLRKADSPEDVVRLWG